MASVDPIRNSEKLPLSWQIASFALLAIVASAVVFHSQIYAAADGFGWISHSRDVQTFINGNWLPGEYRNCGRVAPGNLDCSADSLDVLQHVTGRSLIEYDDWMHNVHVLPVTFHGPIAREQVKFWRCQRRQESLECSLLD